MTSIKLTHEKLYAMCVEWTKFSEIENHSLFIWLLHAVFFFFLNFFKFYVLMQSKTMKHDAIYLDSSTEALCIC